MAVLLFAKQEPGTAASGAAGGYDEDDVRRLPIDETVRLDPFGTEVFGFEAPGDRLVHVHLESITGNYFRFCFLELEYKQAFLDKEPVPCWDIREMAGRAGLSHDYEKRLEEGGYGVGIRCLDGSHSCNLQLRVALV